MNIFNLKQKALKNVSLIKNEFVKTFNQENKAISILKQRVNNFVEDTLVPKECINVFDDTATSDDSHESDSASINSENLSENTEAIKDPDSKNLEKRENIGNENIVKREKNDTNTPIKREKFDVNISIKRENLDNNNLIKRDKSDTKNIIKREHIDFKSKNIYVDSCENSSDNTDDDNNLVKLLKRKDVKLTSVKGQRIIRVDSVQNLLKENAYFIAYIRELLIAPVQSINLYLDKMILDFARLVSVLPASLILHDSKEGGLLSHSLHTALKAVELIKQYKGSFVKSSFNEIETVCLALIHDLGKLITDVEIEDELSKNQYHPLCIEKDLFLKLEKSIKDDLLNTFLLKESSIDSRYLFVCSDIDLLISIITDTPAYSTYFSFYPLDEFIKRTNSSFLFLSYRQKRSYNHDAIFIFVLSIFIKNQVHIIKKIQRHKGVSYIHSILTKKEDKNYRTLLKRADIFACFTSQMNNFGVNCVEEYLYEFIKSGLFSKATKGCFNLKNGYFIEYGSIAHQKLVRAFDCFYALKSRSSSVDSDLENYKKIVDEINSLYESDDIKRTDEVFLQNYTFKPFFKALTDTSILTQRSYKRSCTYTELTDSSGIRHIVYGFHILLEDKAISLNEDIYTISFDVLEKEVKDKLIPAIKKYLIKKDPKDKKDEKTSALEINCKKSCLKHKRKSSKLNVDESSCLVDEITDSTLECSLDELSLKLDENLIDDNPDSDLTNSNDAPFTYIRCTKGSSHICLVSVNVENLDTYFDMSSVRFNLERENRLKEGIARYKAKRKANSVSKTNLNMMLSDTQKDEKEHLKQIEQSQNNVVEIDWF